MWLTNCVFSSVRPFVDTNFRSQIGKASVWDNLIAHAVLELGELFLGDETRVPSGAVIPCALQKVKAHANFHGREIAAACCLSGCVPRNTK